MTVEEQVEREQEHRLRDWPGGESLWMSTEKQRETDGVTKYDEARSEQLL